MPKYELEDLDEIQRWLDRNPAIEQVVDRLDSTRKDRDRFASATAVMASWLRERLDLDEGDDPVSFTRGIPTF